MDAVRERKRVQCTCQSACFLSLPPQLLPLFFSPSSHALLSLSPLRSLPLSLLSFDNEDQKRCVPRFGTPVSTSCFFSARLIEVKRDNRRTRRTQAKKSRNTRRATWSSVLSSNGTFGSSNSDKRGPEQTETVATNAYLARATRALWRYVA